jgi:peptide/nickel transport system substrate-binding protein
VDAGLDPGTTIAIDDFTVQFNLKKPYMPFLSYIAGYYASIFPKAALEARGSEDFFRMPVAGGVWMVKDFERTTHITIVPNPQQNVLPKPFLDEIEIRVYPDATTRMLALQSGRLDLAHAIPPSQIAATAGLPGLDVVQFPMTRLAFILLNHIKPPMDDLNFRMALNYAADKQAIINTVLFGYGEVATSYQPKGVPMFDATVPGYPYDLELAKEYLAKSKYADGVKFELWVNKINETNVDIVTA